MSRGIGWEGVGMAEVMGKVDEWGSCRNVRVAVLILPSASPSRAPPLPTHIAARFLVALNSARH